MKIITAEHAGFCFGVKRAVDRVFALTEEFPECAIYTIGELIHNPQIIAELEARGVRVISEQDAQRIAEKADAAHPARVVIRTHGIPGRMRDHLLRLAEKNPAFSVVDCTCPYVARIHDIVRENSGSGALTVIIGDASHPEVQGISGCAAGEVMVFPDAEALESAVKDNKFLSNRVIMVSQTTQKLTEWKNCQKIIRKACTNALIFDTICSVTEIRQTEANDLSKNVDLMLVIGGRTSSNTNKLYTIAAQNMEQRRRSDENFHGRAFLMESEKELPLDLLTPQTIVGITAGASTPSSIIEEVIKHMNENAENVMASEAEDFAGMLEGNLKTLNTGEAVTGEITSITPNEIHVDLNAKVTGIIPYSEITDNPSANIENLYHVGDTIEAIVIKVSDLDGVATLSRRKIESVLNWKKIVAAYEAGAILEGQFTNVVKGGALMLLDGVQVFVPASHTGLPKDADLSVLVGTTARAKIIEIDERRHRAVASVRAVLREERKAQEAAFWANIEEGKQYTGVVKSLTSYGAFVDLGGVDGMVHCTELSWKRIHHPSEVVSIGDTITVYVKSFDPETKRISLGYKTEETNPWNVFTSRYKVGDVAKVKIVSMMPFGAFAEIVPGADGLIHISQISDKKVAKPSDVLELGQVVDAKIVGIDEENHRISLSIRALLEDAEDADEE